MSPFIEWLFAGLCSCIGDTLPRRSTSVSFLTRRVLQWVSQRFCFPLSSLSAQVLVFDVSWFSVWTTGYHLHLCGSPISDLLELVVQGMSCDESGYCWSFVLRGGARIAVRKCSSLTRSSKFSTGKNWKLQLFTMKSEIFASSFRFRFWPSAFLNWLPSMLPRLCCWRRLVLRFPVLPA